MTGPEHYREAEKLIAAVNRRLPRTEDLLHPREQRLELQAKAQVHATLALTAASVIGALHSPAQFRAWREVIKEPQEAPDAE